MSKNITCPKCRHRHPADVSCPLAAERAAEERRLREEYARQHPVLTETQALQQTIEELTRRIEALERRVFEDLAS